MFIVPIFAIIDEALLKFGALVVGEHFFQEQLAQARVTENVATLFGAIADNEAGHDLGCVVEHGADLEMLRGECFEIGNSERAERGGAETEQGIYGGVLGAVLLKLVEPDANEGLKAR